MATCKDCLHYEACSFKLPFYQVEKLMPCARFKDKSQYAEVKHGEWVVEAFPVDGDDVVILPYKEHQHNEPFCSICHKYALLNGGEEYVTSNYCPNCGAKMDGGKDG